MPGETTPEEARQILNTIGAYVVSDRQFVAGGNGWGLGLQFDANLDTIQSIDISSTNSEGITDEVAYRASWQPFSVAEVLRRYGVPSQVVSYIPFQGDFGGGQAYILFLFYEELGVVIKYTGLAEPLGESQYQVCPEINKFWDIHLMLYPPGSRESMVQQVFPPEELDNLWPGIGYEQITWQGITGTDLAAFQELFTSGLPEGEGCFELPHITEAK